jgi:hypothetical protein
MRQTTLRSIVATIEGELAQLGTYAAGDVPPTAVLELRASWARLVAMLALGPEPEVRSCPVCNRNVARAAMRCSFCWTKLRPAMSNEA